MRKVWMVAMMVSACGVDDEVASTEQAISGWAVGAWGTQHDLIGADTGWPASSSTCVMSAVLGDLGEGGYWDVEDVPSYAAVTRST